MLAEILAEQEKVKPHFISEVSRLRARIGRVEFDNANLLENNSSIKQNWLLKQEIDHIEKLLHELTDFKFLELTLEEKEDIRPFNCILLDDNTIMAAYTDKLMRVWSTKDGSLLQRVAGHRPRVYGHRSNYISIHYTPQSPFILTYESDMTTTLRLWDKKSFLQLSSLTLDKKIVDIKLSSDGLSFVSYSEDPIVIVRWTIEGANVGKSTLSKYPAIFKVNDSEQIPTFKFKK
ncbi:unnamed protein product [Mytilus coruscus]|uniref:Uncharacterized protein n=1 Tax=Mytilus coruscus TaxID=42192 RepID=A0A6J7ZYU4_MYTCO|nr:unnamed protein product [Mytilus coruscus]